MPGFEITGISPLTDENGPPHRTDDYETESLVVRRGQPFLIDIHHENYDQDEDKFHITLKTGKKPKEKDGSLIDIYNDEPSKDKPFFDILSVTDDTIRVSVTTTATTLVSCYLLAVTTIQKQGRKRQRIETELDNPVYILFNPWNEDDEVYMEDESLKEEYVLNDQGWVFVSGQRSRPWYFGQFTEATLETTFTLLNQVRPSWRDNAKEVARNISSRCNSYDNNGVLEGNWTGDYDGGAKPWEWSGSVAIFKKYLETGESVKYGQCWVFSGLTTSMMRCLGIPARSVTNYDSAHDSDNNCTFDRYFDEDWNYMEDESDDSCWNFHVWNDVWMARPDLPAGMGGWQAMDGTPQEESKGSYRCGPASLQAIREGEVNRPYDTRFVFAEVNADTVYWKPAPEDDEREWVAVRIKKDNVGTAILTKMPNANVTQDITSEYKHKEGSIFERATVMNALKKAKNPAVEDIDEKDVKFSSKVERNVSTEDPLVVEVKAKNNTSEAATISVAVRAYVIRYTGVRIGTLEVQTHNRETLQPNSEESYTFNYDASMYKEYLDENIAIRFVIVSRILGTSQAYVTQKICDIQKPDLQLQVVDVTEGQNVSDGQQVKSGDQLLLTVNIPGIYGVDKYTDITLDIDCAAVQTSQSIRIGDKPADGSAVIEQALTLKSVKKPKKSDLVVTLNSKEISGIHGSINLDIKPRTN